MKSVTKRLYMVGVLVIIGVCAVMFLAGCSDENTDIVTDIVSNVLLSVTELDFGQVNIDTFRIETVTIRNIQNENVTIERVTSTNDAFQIGGYFTGGQLIELEVPFTIEGNGSRTLYIGFYPDMNGEFVGKIVVESTDENAVTETDLISVKGVGLPDLQ